MAQLQNISFQQVDLTEGFWHDRQNLNRDVTVGAVERRFRDTGRFEAFKFNWTPDSNLPRPHFFWDSDLAKWIESVAYLLQKGPQPALYASARAVIDDIAAHQQADGYFNIFHTVVEPENRFRYRDRHELYCLGHLIEAAVAWVNATGERDFLETLDRYIDLVIRVFQKEKSAAFTTPGHEEIELALLKLYRLQPEKKYLDLALFFLNERGPQDQLLGDWARDKYNQSHLRVREQHTAEGHCVRACYLYCAMADAAALTEDEALLAACRDLFDDIVEKKMYLTGGIGSTHHGEAFTVPYDLPNDTAYAETCAAIALAMFARRMQIIDPDSKYADVVERTLYNGILSGVSLDGISFFYENPLEICLADHEKNRSVNGGDRLPITQRLEVFDCSCCPPNVTRLLASLGDYVFTAGAEDLYVQQYIPCRASFDSMDVEIKTVYPIDGQVTVTVRGGKGKRLHLRVPGWCKEWTCSAPCETAHGYAVIDVTDDEFAVQMDFDMTPQWITANPRVKADAGKLALMRGPVVYCAEGVDHPFSLFSVAVDSSAPTEIKEAYGGLPTLQCGGWLPQDNGALYSPASETEEKKTPVTLRFIPYFTFANRGSSDLLVWLRRL